jgi:hypothetical protein
MKNYSKIAGLILAATSLAAAPAWAADTCFRANELSKWVASDEQTIQLENIAGQLFNLQLKNRCRGLEYTDQLSVQIRAGSCLAVGDYIKFYNASQRETKCEITSLTPAASSSAPAQ